MQKEIESSILKVLTRECECGSWYVLLQNGKECEITVEDGIINVSIPDSEEVIKYKMQLESI